MTPMSDGETAILGRLADVLQQQAVHTERQTGMIERLDDRLSRMEDDRAEDHAGLKTHIADAISKSDTWWRRAFFIAVGALALAQIAGASLPPLLWSLKPN